MHMRYILLGCLASPVSAVATPPHQPVDSFCNSSFVIEGDITSVHERAFGMGAEIEVERALKGEVPAVVLYAHQVGSHAFDRLIVGDHVIVFGEYDAERGYILNNRWRHLVRDNSREPPVMYHRTPGMNTRREYRSWPPDAIIAIYPTWKEAHHLRSLSAVADADAANDSHSLGSEDTHRLTDGDPRDLATSWSVLVEQIVTAIAQNSGCAVPGSYPED